MCIRDRYRIQRAFRQTYRACGKESKIMDNKCIGVFDSGLGGLTAVKQIINELPKEDIIYFGDTGRVPYGSRSKETLLKYTRCV